MQDDVWTVRRILEWIEGYLAKRGDGSARLSAQWLVSEALGMNRIQLYVDMERPLTQAERDVLRDYTRRRGAGEPLQYITGEAAFRHIVVKVREGVLIPRPETEVLVSEALAMLPAPAKPQEALDADVLRRYLELGGSLPEGGSGEYLMQEQPDCGRLLVADLCTGSGCIACSIAAEHPRTRIVATDISPVAVALARENVDALDLSERVDVVECSLGEGIDSDLVGKFDLIVSNPPYVPTEVLSELPREVIGFEPRLALDGGADGLDVFRQIVAWSREALRPGGGLAVELHETCLDEARALVEQAGFTGARIVEDLAARPRVLTARLSDSERVTSVSPSS